MAREIPPSHCLQSDIKRMHETGKLTNRKRAAVEGRRLNPPVKMRNDPIDRIMPGSNQRHPCW
jgi:hypothetical protein